MSGLVEDYDELPVKYQKELKILKRNIKKQLDINFEMQEVYYHKEDNDMTAVIVFNMNDGKRKAAVNYFKVIRTFEARDTLKKIGFIYPLDTINLNKYEHIYYIHYDINVRNKGIYYYNICERVCEDGFHFKYIVNKYSINTEFISRFKHDAAKIVLDAAETLAIRYCYVCLPHVMLENIKSNIDIEILYKNKDTNKYILRIYLSHIDYDLYPYLEDKLDMFLCNSEYYDKYIEFVEIW